MCCDCVLGIDTSVTCQDSSKSCFNSCGGVVTFIPPALSPCWVLHTFMNLAKRREELWNLSRWITAVNVLHKELCTQSHRLQCTSHNNMQDYYHLCQECIRTTVKPLITDSPKGGQPQYSGQMPCCRHLSTLDNSQPACPILVHLTQLVNLWDRDNFSITDKSPAPNVSTVRRFHYIISTPTHAIELLLICFWDVESWCTFICMASVPVYFLCQINTLPYWKLQIDLCILSNLIWERQE